MLKQRQCKQDATMLAVVYGQLCAHFIFHFSSPRKVIIIVQVKGKEVGYSTDV